MPAPAPPADALESRFDPVFTTRLALREKQIQQRYRPVIGVHKWFARRPGSVFRALLLAEFGAAPPAEGYFRGHALRGVIGDPFMGGGTPLFEANRLGFHVVGCDINPMAHWIVRQSLLPLDGGALRAAAAALCSEVEAEIGDLYLTRCAGCGADAQVKYFLWVKTAACPGCAAQIDLFPGHLLAEAVRHPRHVLVCAACGALNELDALPDREPAACTACAGPVQRAGNVRRNQARCPRCALRFPLHLPVAAGPPPHRLWAIEYHCAACYPAHKGRLFKAPDDADRRRVQEAQAALAGRPDLPLPPDEIPAGDETDRLHRWGYRRYRELFNDRQLLGLGTLLLRICQVPDVPVRHALLTIFSDTLRYQNLLCRYDTYALKCQDIFSVHGFPVGLLACENSLLGTPAVGSGSFRHFVEKYARAKAYCAAPFEIRPGERRPVPITGEDIRATIVERDFPAGADKQALLLNLPSQEAPLPPGVLDGVFTDPPYFDNVQYAELIDFCYVWLRQALAAERPEFRRPSTRSDSELTGNETRGRRLLHFTEGLAQVFCHFAGALRPGAPFVFTYHHNDAAAYAPLVVAMLDAGLRCTATLPVAAEMSASLHIAGTGSSILDSVFVCRAGGEAGADAAAVAPVPSLPVLRAACAEALVHDQAQMVAAGVKVSEGDLRCLRAGHLARLAVAVLRPSWDAARPAEARLHEARALLAQLAASE